MEIKLMTRFNFSDSSKFSKAEDSPGFLLWRTSSKWRKAIESALKQFDLTHPQFVILTSIGWLNRDKDNINQIEIARHAGLDANTTSQILRSLQSKNLIERKHSKDERSKSITLTSLGSQLLTQALPAVENADKNFFSIVNLHKTYAIEALKILAQIEP